MKLQNYQWILGLLILGIASCSGNKTDKGEADKTVSTALPQPKTEVSVCILKEQDFHHELVSNGKLSARKSVDLRFQSSEPIAHIYVKNGDRVQKGQKLAELDKFKLSNRLEQAKVSLEQAKLNLQDVLIGQGYRLADSSKVPEPVLALARVKSGYDQSKAQYEMARYEFENATLIAPFDGMVANLFAKPFNTASTSDVFCTIIDNRHLEAVFTVLESELPLIKKGDKVNVSPFTDKNNVCEGAICDINPVVDANGMVKVRALVDGKSSLFEGMNVRIMILRSVDKQLVLPKTAIVLRSNKQVVFSLKNDSVAYWNYVKTGLENMTEYTLVESEGLKLGDTIIVSGNINLAHEAPVVVGKE